MRHKLHGLFFAIVVAGTATACDQISLDGFDEPECLASNPRILRGGYLDEAPDYIALMRRDPGGTDTVIDQLGTACGSATTTAACEAASDVTVERGFTLGDCGSPEDQPRVTCDEHYLLVNTGDEWEVLDNEYTAREILGEVGWSGEAVAAALLGGYSVACGDLEKGGVKTAGDAFEVIATRMTHRCDPMDITRYRLRVSRAGGVAVIEEEIIESIEGACTEP
jgi:hypothetical protein